MDKDCEVLIPWWGSVAPRYARILTDQAENLDAVIGGHASRLETSTKVGVYFSGQRVLAHVFMADMSASNSPLMTLRLSAHKPWTLYGISFTS